jgi:hypothetical protein
MAGIRGTDVARASFGWRALVRSALLWPWLIMLACGMEAGACSGAEEVAVEPPATTVVVHESRSRQDFADANTPRGLRVVQISADPEMISRHMYPEAHMFTLDSKRFVFFRTSIADATKTGYWLCDIEDNFGLRQLTDEPGARGRCAVSPDGKWMYYFVDRTRSPERLLKLKRVSLEDFTRQTLMVLDGPIPGIKGSQPGHWNAVAGLELAVVPERQIGDGPKRIRQTRVT